MLEIPIEIAASLVLAIPLATIIFVVLLNLLRNRVQNPRLLWFIEKMLVPPSTSTGDESVTEDATPSSQNQISLQKLLSILTLVYLGLFLFLIGNMLGVFYNVMGDALEAVNQGSTGTSRIVRSIVFLDPFNAGWTGTLPWYGSYPMPLYGADIYHDTWEWVYFTGILMNNPDFFNSFLSEIILYTFAASLYFLLPLLIGPIRRSFIPSLFLFISGMYVASTALLRCLAQVLEIGYLGEAIGYGNYELSIIAVDPAAALTIISALVPYVLLLAVVFPLLGYKIWRGFYPSNRKSAIWFALYIVGSYWLTFLIALW